MSQLLDAVDKAAKSDVMLHQHSVVADAVWKDRHFGTFRGELASVVTCSVCRNESRRGEACDDISIEVCVIFVSPGHALTRACVSVRAGCTDARAVAAKFHAC